MTDLVEAYDRARAMVEAYDATGLASLLPPDATVIDDGRSAEGVPPVTTGGLRLVVANTRALIQQLATVDPQTGLSLIDGARSVSPRYA